MFYFGYINRILLEIEEKENLLCLVLKIGNLKGLVREERFFFCSLKYKMIRFALVE